MNSEDYRQKISHAYYEKQNAQNGENKAFKIVEEEKKIYKIKNGMTIRLAFEDHTIGNLIRMQLLKKKKNDVKFAGYKVPHPLDDVVEIKMQTIDSVKPEKALDECIDSIIEDIDYIQKSLEDELKNKENIYE